MMFSSGRAAAGVVLRKCSSNSRCLVGVGSRCGSRTMPSSSSLSSMMSTYAPVMDERLDRVDLNEGPGGRNSETGVKVAVFGASGFLGNYVCYELGSNGFLGYLGNRGCEFEMRHLKPYFELGRTRYVFYSPRDLESIRNVIADADVVINMIGKYYETTNIVQKESFPYLAWENNFTFEETNVTVARNIAEICKEMQVDHLIHVSSAAAKPDANSRWARTKYEGEQAVKEAYPWATIIRPTQLFGREDRLLNWFASIGIMYRFMPLVDKGDQLTQPVWVADVAKTIVNIVNNPEKYAGQTVDCFGPNDITYKEIAEFVNELTERDRKIVKVPRDILEKVIAKVLQFNRLGGAKPMMTPDLMAVMSEDYIPELKTQEAYDAQPRQPLYTTSKTAKFTPPILTMKDAGVTATPIEKIAFSYMHRYRFGGHFRRVQGYH